jgi:hypothetical protein
MHPWALMVSVLLAQASPPPPDPPALEAEKSAEVPHEQIGEVVKSQQYQLQQAQANQKTVDRERALSHETKVERDKSLDKSEARQDVIKGDLTTPGTTMLVSRFNHAGVQFGAEILDSQPFALINPVTAWYFERWSFALQAPLHLLIYDVDNLKYGQLKIRREDWDQASDYLRVIRFLTFGRKEDNIYVSINTLRPYTLGHGMLFERYQPNIDFARTNTGLMFDMYNDYGGFQAQINDLTFQNQVMGFLLFAKPMRFFTNNAVLKTLSFGLEYGIDAQAPRCIKTSASSNQCVQARGNSGDVDRFTGIVLDNSYARSQSDGLYASQKSMVHALGLSAEIKAYKLPGMIDIKGYQTFHYFLNAGGGPGLGTGALGRFTFGNRWLNAFRIRAEMDNYGNGFIPSYFDTLYEVNKYEFAIRSSPYEVNPTKYQRIFGDKANGFERPNEGWRVGYKLDAMYSLFHGKRANKQLALGFGIQDSTGPHDSSFYTHIEFPYIGWIQLFATYMRVKGDNFKNLFVVNRSAEDIILSGLRFQILPIMFLNVQYARIYKVLRSGNQEYHLGNARIPVPANRVAITQDRLYETTGNLMITLEFGYEASDDEPAEEAGHHDS